MFFAEKPPPSFGQAGVSGRSGDAESVSLQREEDAASQRTVSEVRWSKARGSSARVRRQPRRAAPECGPKLRSAIDASASHLAARSLSETRRCGALPERSSRATSLSVRLSGQQAAASSPSSSPCPGHGGHARPASLVRRRRPHRPRRSLCAAEDRTPRSNGSLISLPPSMRRFELTPLALHPKQISKYSGACKRRRSRPSFPC